MPIHLIDEAKNNVREREYNRCFETIDQIIEGLKLNEKEYYTFILEQVEHIRKRHKALLATQEDQEETNHVLLAKISDALETFLSLVWYKEEDKHTQNKKVSKKLKVIIVTNDTTYFWEEIPKIIHVLNEYTDNSIRRYKRLFKTEENSYIGIEVKRNGALIMKLKSIAKLKLIPFVTDIQVLDSYLDDFYRAMNELYINLENINLSRSVELMKLYWIDISEQRSHIFSLAGFDLSWANFSHSNINGFNFSSANLSNASFENATIKNTSFLNTKLPFSNFSNVILKNINLSGSDFSQANLQNADLSKTKIIKANLRGANLSNSYLDYADLEQANLLDANLTKTNLIGANFSKAECVRTNFSKSDLKRTLLGKAYLVNANFSECNLHFSVFANTVCQSADFTKAKFTFTDFSNADCTEAKFTEASLHKANFSKTQLNSATFLDADLGDTSFVSAELANTIFSAKDKERLKKQNLPTEQFIFKNFI